MVLLEKIKIVWQRFHSVAGVIALLAGLVAIGVWIGDWRAEQVHRDKTDTISQLRNELVEVKSANVQIQRDVQLKAGIVETQTEELAAANAQIARLRQELLLLDSKRIQESDIGKREMDRMKLSSTEAAREIERLHSSFRDVIKERDDLRRMLNERRPVLQVLVNEAEAPQRFVVVLKNPTETPIRVVRTRGQSWWNKRAGTESAYGQIFMVLRGVQQNAYTFNLTGDLTSFLKKKEDYRAAICFIYESTQDTERRQWRNDSWFVYRHDREDGNRVSSSAVTQNRPMKVT